jgi:hypothetical protein
MLPDRLFSSRSSPLSALSSGIVSTVGVMLNLVNPMNDPILPQMNQVASSRKLTLRQYDARSPADFGGVISAMKADVGAFVLLDDSMLIDNAPAIAKLALKHGLPSIGFPSYAEADGLLAFGIDFAELFWARCNVRRQDHIVLSRTGSAEVVGGGGGCLLWVNKRHQGRSDLCPLYPSKRTLIDRAESSLQKEKGPAQWPVPSVCLPSLW